MTDLVHRRQVSGTSLRLSASLATEVDPPSPVAHRAMVGGSGTSAACGVDAGQRVLCDSKDRVGVPDGNRRIRGEGVAGREGATGSGAGARSETEYGVPRVFAEDEVGTVV